VAIPQSRSVFRRNCVITFTAGAGWAYDYGTADDSAEMFEYPKDYSPLHNIKEDFSQYPAALITTGDHLTTVWFSFKFTASYNLSRLETILH
jgi:prolyl oligopeptidase PreP (S9A serine peptidase family)